MCCLPSFRLVMRTVRKLLRLLLASDLWGSSPASVRCFSAGCCKVHPIPRSHKHMCLLPLKFHGRWNLFQDSHWQDFSVIKLCTLVRPWLPVLNFVPESPLLYDSIWDLHSYEINISLIVPKEYHPVDIQTCSLRHGRIAVTGVLLSSRLMALWSENTPYDFHSLALQSHCPNCWINVNVETGDILKISGMYSTNVN